MRLPWLAPLAAGAVLAVSACGPGDEAQPSLEPMDAIAPTPAAIQAPARLCDAIPRDLVADATGRSPVTVDGAGEQCSWRVPSPTDGAEVVLQGSFIDTRSFDVVRPGAGATTVQGIGDDAYLVEVGDGAPTTLYVRDGHQAFALWLTHPAAGGTLALLAGQVLAD